jgi:hypothetical protein
VSISGNQWHPILSVSIIGTPVHRCQSLAPRSIGVNQRHPIRSLAISGNPAFLTWGLRPHTPVTARASRALTIVTRRRGVAVRQRKQLGPPLGTSCPQMASLRELWRGVTQLPLCPCSRGVPCSLVRSLDHRAHHKSRARACTTATSVTPSHSISLHATPPRHHATTPPRHHATTPPRHLWSSWSRAAVPPPSFGDFGRAVQARGIRDIKPLPHWVFTYY